MKLGAWLRKMIKAIISEKKVEPPFFTRDWLSSSGFQIGEFTYGRPAIMHFGEQAALQIGKFCSIADGVTIFLGGNHRTDWVSTFPFNKLPEAFPNGVNITGHPISKGNITIGNDVWIGYGATILSGIIIGDGAVIAAKAVVTKNVAPYEIVGGNPAKHLKYRFNENEISELLRIKWWNWDIDKIKSNLYLVCQPDIAKFIAKNPI